MIQSLGKETIFLLAVAANVVLLAWLLLCSSTVAIALLSAALVVSVTCIVLSRALGPSILDISTVSAAAALGMLLGCTLEFGRTGLLILSSLCLTVTDESAVEAAVRLFSLSPVTHIGMWLGCSISLLASRRISWLEHACCLFGMVLGMVFIGTLPATAFPLLPDYFAIASVGWMWLATSLGMCLSLGFCKHLPQVRSNLADVIRVRDIKRQL